MKTGRPVVSPDAYVDREAAPADAGLRRRPQLEPHVLQPADRAGLHPGPGDSAMVESAAPDGQFKFVLGRTPSARATTTTRSCAASSTPKAADSEKGYMLAWDPVRQKEAFRIPYPHAGQRRNAWSPPATCWSRAPSTRPWRSTAPTTARSSGRCRSERVPVSGRGDLHDRRHAIHRHQRGLEQRHRPGAGLKAAGAVHACARRASWSSRSTPRA